MTLGVDVGGTFTDVAVWDGASMSVGKVPSTPRDQSEGVMAGAGAAVQDDARADLLHGTTVATNALLERRGARTLLVTDAGFESLIEIARQDRPSLYDPFADRARPLADHGMRLGIEVRAADRADQLDAVADPEAAAPGRADQLDAVADPEAAAAPDRADQLDAVADPEAAAAPDRADDPDVLADSVAAVARDRGAEAVAVCLMYSYADPVLERALAERLRRTVGVPVSASAEVVAEFREYERFSTAVLNAFLSPEVARYMGGLADRAQRSDFIDEISVMRSSGGLVSLDHASAFPASILLSGPAGGVVAAAALGELMGCDTLISFDMGGTSTDVCRVRQGRPEVTYNREIAGHACLMPSVAVHTVGAGGGSVAWADPGGALRVGPRSAGAEPGPACYGRGGVEPTVTDANLVLGRLDPSTKLAGSVALRADLAADAFGRLGSELSLDATEAALGVVAVVESHMTHAVRAVSVEQGTDPRDAALMAFGGAGGLHATALARSLEMDGVIVPPYAGVFSAFGLLLSPPRADAARTVNLIDSNRGRLPSEARRLLAAARSQIEADSGQAARAASVIVDMRYLGQAHETSVPLNEGEPWEALCERFHRLHAQRNGFSRPDDPVEAVTVRAEAVGSAALSWADLPEFRTEPGEARRGSRTVIERSGPVEAQVWWRPALPVGSEVVGPAIIAEGESTTYLATGERAAVHETGALRIDW